MRIVVVGGGIVGVAAARQLAREHEVTLLEKEQHLACHQSGRNAGVVHAGLYYAPGSSKARLCRRGGELLREFVAQHEIPYQAVGKLVVALDEGERERLERLHERAQANGVPGLRLLDAAGLREVEPHAHGVAALHSPTSAIVDFVAVTEALAGQLRERGGVLRTGAEVRSVDRDGVVELVGGERLVAERVLVCAGLQSDRLARAGGEPRAPVIVPFRGGFWRIRADRAQLVRGLIYPVPDPTLPFLGVHLTRRIDGQVWVGPNALPALARERYSRFALSPRDLAETLAFPGTWRLLRRHWRAALHELAPVDPGRYVPELKRGDLEPAPAGIRAQALERDGTLLDDFALARSGRVVFVRNAPSPAATASMAIAEELCERLLA
jgi:L-2-hydroxyglutarate oxidase LhgO